MSTSKRQNIAPRISLPAKTLCTTAFWVESVSMIARNSFANWWWFSSVFWLRNAIFIMYIANWSISTVNSIRPITLHIRETKQQLLSIFWTKEKIIVTVFGSFLFLTPNAMSFYRSKMILYRPNYIGWVQIVLVESNLFWSGPNHFGQVQIRLFWTIFFF